MLNLRSTALLATLGLATMLQVSAAPVPQSQELLDPRWKFSGGKGSNSGSSKDHDNDKNSNNHGPPPKNSFGKDLAISGAGSVAGSIPMMYMMNSQSSGGGEEGQVQRRSPRVALFRPKIGGGKGGSSNGKPTGGAPNNNGHGEHQKPSFMREMGVNVGGGVIGTVPMFAMGSMGGGGGGSGDASASSDPASST